MKKNFIYSFCLCLAAIMMSLSAMAQTMVKGTVVDEAGQPVIGATVIVKGTTTGTTTGLDGQFNVVVPQNGALEISFLGYITETVTSLNNPKVVLKEDRQNIEEVVVVGYGTQKKAHLTGSVTSVDTEDIQDIVSGDLGTTLQGLMPGVSVSGGNSTPGERSQIFVRGAGDLSALNTAGAGGAQTFVQEPLYVIDGYAYPNSIGIGNNNNVNLGAEAFSNLDPTMIESISVLKDASAAVYGARAANGVILVTTKRGKEGAPQISYSGSVGISNQAHPKMLNAYQYGRLYNIMQTADPYKTNTNLNATTDLFQLDELNAMKSLNYNMLDDHWSAAVKQKHSLNITGATEKANYFAGIAFFDQDGNIGNFMDQRWNYRAGVDVKVTKWLKAGLSITGDYGKKNSSVVKIGGSNQRNDYNMLLMRPRYIPEYVNGLPIAAYGVTNEEVDGNQLYHYNELQNNGDRSRNMSSNMSIQGNLSVDFGEVWKPLQGLTARLNYGKSITTDKTNQMTSEFTIYTMTERAGSGSHLYTPIPGQEEAWEALMAPENFVALNLTNSNGGDSSAFISREMARTDNYQINFQVNYGRTFGKHTVGAMFNIEKSESESEWSWATIDDPYSFSTGQSTTATGTKDLKFTRSEGGSLAYLGRLNYAYDDKYLLEGLVRVDYSTKFAPKNYKGIFPSVSAGWVVSKEGWFQDNVSWIDFLKLRASFGLTGRDNCTPWQWMQSYSTSEGTKGGPVFGTGISNETQNHITTNKNIAAVNSDVHWDKSYKMNIGMDWNLLHNRLGFTIEGYKEWNREMLMILAQQVPSTVGTASAAVNMGEMDSWGLEFSVNWSDRIGKDFKYKINISTGYSDNKVLVADFETDSEKIYKSMQKGDRTDIGSWGMQCIGMFRSFQDINEYVEKYNITSYMGMPVEDIRPGMLMYKDVRGAQYDPETKTYSGPDGSVSDEYDQVRLSNRSNPYGLTANLSAEWKGLSLNAQISASWGGYSFVPNQAIQTDDIEVFNMPSFWNPDDVYSYQDIYDVNGQLLIAENRNASMPNPVYSDVNARQSSFWRVSGTRVNLRRLTLAYSLPKKWLQPIGISSVRVNVTGTNLLSFYNPYPDKFMDPLAGSYGNYPNLRNWTIGLNVNF